ncbi:MAG TPA: lysylphosphatidylglycerol synthase transmembrane domain-containing protein [Gaiellaceae bacterium]
MGNTLQQVRSRLGTRGLAATAAVLLALVVAVATPQLLGTRVAAAFGALDNADPKWLWLAGIGFAVSVVAAAGSWLCAIRLCGGTLTLPDACARYGAGSLVNTFVPARAGDAIRIGLFSRVLPNRERLWTTGSAFAALGAARSVVLAALIVAGSATGTLPLWPLFVALGLVTVAAAVSLRARGRDPESRAGHLLDSFRALGREPAAAIRLVAWIALSTAGRLAAATAVAAALGIHHPLAAAVVIIPALEVAGLVPLTPGNIGITSGAIALAFQSQGVSFTNGLAAGIAFHAVETAVGLMFGIASVVWLAPYRSPAIRRVVLLTTAASWALGIAGAFSATVLVPLV